MKTFTPVLKCTDCGLVIDPPYADNVQNHICNKRPVYKTIGDIVEQLEYCEYLTKDNLHALEMNEAFILLRELSSAPILDCKNLIEKRNKVKRYWEKRARR